MYRYPYRDWQLCQSVMSYGPPTLPPYVDQSNVASSVKQLREMEKQQIRKANAEQPHKKYRCALPDEGTYYPVDVWELYLLQEPAFGPHDVDWWRPFPPPITKEQAYTQLFAPHSIEWTWEWRAACERLVDVMDTRYPLTWDLLVKVFNDLDMVVFHGDLFRRVLFKWVDVRLCGSPTALAYAQPPTDWHTERIKIAMSSVEDWSQHPPSKAFGTLLHEMLHAYFEVWCRDDFIETEFASDRDKYHGVIWMKAAKKIEKIVAADLTTRPKPVEKLNISEGTCCGNKSMDRLG